MNTQSKNNSAFEMFKRAQENARLQKWLKVKPTAGQQHPAKKNTNPSSGHFNFKTIEE